MFVTFHPGVTLVSALADPTALWGVFQYHPHCGHCCPSHARAATVYHATHAASGDSLFYTSDYIILIIIQIGWHVGGWQQCSTGSSSGCYPMMSSIGKSRPCLVKNGHKCHPVFFQRDSSLWILGKECGSVGLHWWLTWSWWIVPGTLYQCRPLPRVGWGKFSITWSSSICIFVITSVWNISLRSLSII